MAESVKERWANGSRYEGYMGRWSRLLAIVFLDWATFPAGGRWLDVGCGTGNLANAILGHAQPTSLLALDASEGFVTYAAQRGLAHTHFCVATAQSLPLQTGAFDVVVAGLMLNFVPSVPAALEEMRRVARPGGDVGAYVWDYADGMGMLRTFFDAAIHVDSDAIEHDEGKRFPICQPDALHDALLAAGFDRIAVAPISISARFRDFDDYWNPFVEGGRFPAAAWLMSRPESTRMGIRERLREILPTAGDGSITLEMRAWAVKAIRPAGTNDKG